MQFASNKLKISVRKLLKRMSWSDIGTLHCQKADRHADAAYLRDFQGSRDSPGRTAQLHRRTHQTLAAYWAGKKQM
jgi:hypothetical protein